MTVNAYELLAPLPLWFHVSTYGDLKNVVQYDRAVIVRTSCKIVRARAIPVRCKLYRRAKNV